MNLTALFAVDVIRDDTVVISAISQYSHSVSVKNDNNSSVKKVV